MRQWIFGVAAAAVALSVGSAMAGPAETKFLNSLAGTWTGSGVVKGPQSGDVDCSITFTPTGAGVAFNGKCNTDLGPPQITRGAITYNDKTKRYEASGRGMVTAGTKSGNTVTFVGKLQDPMLGSGTSTMKISPTQIVTDTTINRTGMQAGTYTTHMVLKR